MWHDVAKDSFTFPWDSHSHGTDEYVESWIHLKIQFALNSNVLQIENKFNKIIRIVLFVTFDVLVGFSWIFKVALHKIVNKI